MAEPKKKNSVVRKPTAAAPAPAAAPVKSIRRQREENRTLELELQRQRENRKDASKSTGETIRQLAFTTAGVGAGIWAGHKFANKIEKRHSITLANRRTQFRDLAKEAGRISPTAAASNAKLRAIVKTADSLKLQKVRGPVGIASAALLLGEGAYSRYLSSTLENESAKEALNAISTASIFAATTLIGERMIQNATPQKLFAAKDMAAIEGARNIAADQKAGKIQIGQKTSMPQVPKATLTKRIGLTSGLLTTTVAAGYLAYDAAKSQAKASGTSDLKSNATGVGAAAVVGTASAVAYKGGVKVLENTAQTLAPVSRSIASKTIGRVALRAGAALIPGANVAVAALSAYELLRYAQSQSVNKNPRTQTGGPSRPRGSGGGRVFVPGHDRVINGRTVRVEAYYR